jgi:methyl-accepting chemotaxis protein
MSLVNLAARQRMLSQRMVMQALRAARGEAAQLDAARQSLTLFTDSQRRLESTPRELEPDAAHLIEATYRGPRGVAGRIADFVLAMQSTLEAMAQGGRRSDDALVQLIEQADPVLEALNTATSAFDHIARLKADAVMRELTSIVESIQTVAREAKIVSFNAQVMAARAGTHGREFAVVADVLSRITAEINELSVKALALAALSRQGR